MIASARQALEMLVAEAGRIEREHGFGVDVRPAEDIALMHSELSEALEELRNGHAPSETYFSKLDNVPTKPEGVPAELADVVIRILAFSSRHGIDLASAIIHKMAFNETRPVRHGGKAL